MASKKKVAAIALGALAALALVAPFAVYLQPGLLGADQALIVLTGSMEPAIAPGDVVFVDQSAPIDQVQVGDVVTFEPHPDAGRTYTHRVVAIEQDGRGTLLTTQGDANEDPDPMQVNEQMLVGRVDHTLPLLGKVIVNLQGPLLYLGLVVASIVTVGIELRHLFEDDEDEGPPVAFQVRSTGQDPRRFQPARSTPRFEVTRTR